MSRDSAVFLEFSFFVGKGGNATKRNNGSIFSAIIPYFLGRCVEQLSTQAGVALYRLHSTVRLARPPPTVGDKGGHSVVQFRPRIWKKSNPCLTTSI